jgi:hypothetical protein
MPYTQNRRGFVLGPSEGKGQGEGLLGVVYPAVLPLTRPSVLPTSPLLIAIAAPVYFLKRGVDIPGEAL